jgi:hypothetical protein
MVHVRFAALSKPDPQSVLPKVQMLCQQEKKEHPESCNFRACLAPMSKQASRSFVASADRRFQFYKRSQLFIGTHNVTLSVVAMCVSNEDRSPLYATVYRLRCDKRIGAASGEDSSLKIVEKERGR